MRISLLSAFFFGLISAPAWALNIFTCEPEWAALAKEIGGDSADVYSATTALQDVHRIQARPSLIAKYRQADLLICTGAELEIGWLPALAEKGNNPKLLPGAPGFFEASRYVTMLEVPASVDRALGDVHPYGNPHIQTDVRNILAIAKPLAAKMAELDPDRAAAYYARLTDFESRWKAATVRWQARAKPLAGVSVVSAHKGWVYLYQWLGLKEVATLEPKPGIPPGAGHLEKVLSGLQRQPARMVIYAAYQDPRSARWLSERTGLPAVELPFSVGAAAGAEDLFGLFDLTLDRLLQGAAAKP